MLSSKTLFSLMNIVSVTQANIDYGPEKIQHGYVVDANKAGAEHGLELWNQYEQLLSELKSEYNKAVAFENASRVSEENNAIKA